ncbi:MAG: HypC/HybG/HupF family hydrogenase formation chaperone [Armatimonadia bacterium]
MCLAVPGKVVQSPKDDDPMQQARVSFGGVVKEVSLAYVPEARAGDYVMVHTGFALSVVDEQEANEVLAYLEQLAAEDEAQEAEA